MPWYSDQYSASKRSRCWRKDSGASGTRGPPAGSPGHPAARHRAPQRRDTPAAIAMLTECLSIFGELEDRRGMAVVFRNRGDAHRMAGNLEEAESDLTSALEAFQAIGDRRWIARTHLSAAGLARLRRNRTAGQRHLDLALALSAASAISPPRHERSASWACCSATRATRPVPGRRWTRARRYSRPWRRAVDGRVLASRASLAERRGADPAPLTGEARALCRERGIAPRTRSPARCGVVTDVRGRQRSYPLRADHGRSFGPAGRSRRTFAHASWARGPPLR